MGGRKLLTFGKRVIKSAAAGALHYSGLRQVLTAARRAQVGGRRVLILSYHRVVADFEYEAERSIPGLLVSQRTFEGHVDELTRNGYEIAPLSHALEVVAGTRRPKKDVAVLTFDDGYRDVYDFAWPVMKRKGLPGTVYLASGFVGTNHRFAHDRLYHLLRLSALRSRGKNVLLPESVVRGALDAVDELILTKSSSELLELIGRLESSLAASRNELLPEAGAAMTWDMAREMQKGGVDFGAHTVNHVNLTTETNESLEKEVAASKAQIESELGREVKDFAYPNGYYDRRVVSALVKNGFRSGVTTEDTPNHLGGDLFRLKRKMIWENYSIGPFGYSASLTAAHFDDVFTSLAMRPVVQHTPEAPAKNSVVGKEVEQAGEARA